MQLNTNHHKEMKHGTHIRLRRPGVSRPRPQMSVEQVKSTLADFYGEIANASVKETKRGDDTIYEFQRRVGTKGAFTHARN